MANINTIVAIAYIIIQVSIAVVVSIAGAIHVKRCINKSNSDDNTLTSIKLNQEITEKKTEFDTSTTGSHFVASLTKNATIKDVMSIYIVFRIKGEVKETFNAIDTDCNGYIDQEELRNVLSNVREIVNEMDITECFNDIDKDGDGTISFWEFDDWYLASKMRITSNIKNVFLQFDINGDKHVNCHQLRALLEAMNDENKEITNEEVECVMQELGKLSLNDRISEQEFIDWCYSGTMHFEQRTLKRQETLTTVEEEEEESDINFKCPCTCKQEKGFWKSWSKTVWKMKSVYGALAVHSFDVLTDVLVILEWLKLEDIEDDHIDPQVMAYCAIFVIIFSKFISAIAIYIKDQSIIRCILQFLDLLIFEEIYESHRKIVSQMKNKTLKDKNATIESTLSFKYIRNCEAVFESIPQSMLQLVYVMRTSNVGILFIVSICQSIMSMTNCILNNDYTQMQDDEFSKYKQRLPPTFECFKHGLGRLCEVTYRIGLLALIWTVCGGLAFGILLLIDFVIILLRFAALIREVDEVQFDADTVLLNINSLIVIPTEYVYAFGRRRWRNGFRNGLGETSEEETGAYLFFMMFLDCCCMSCCSFFAALSQMLCCEEGEVTFIPLTRICTSFIQFVFLVLYTFGKPERKQFLFDADHGLYVFIVTGIFYLIYTQYMILFPDFSLPFGVSVRSKWGYALANELSELQKIKVPLNKMPYKKSKLIKYTITNQATFWDEPCQYQDGKPLTAAIIASTKGHDKVVKFLEEYGARYHKYVDIGDFEIPDDLTGKFGAAFSGEILGLKKAIGEYRETMKQNWINGKTEQEIQIWWRDQKNKRSFGEEQSKRRQIKDELIENWDYDYTKCDWKRVFYKINYYNMKNESDFWDEPATHLRDEPITPAVFALAKENYDIVKWLEGKGAVKHNNMDHQTAKKLVFVQ